MSKNDLLRTLGELHFFQGLDADFVEQVSEIAKLVEFKVGETVFREGEPAVSVYVVLTGDVALEICAPGVGCRRILTVGSGDLLGWSPMLGQIRLTATAHAITPTRAVKIDARQMLAICEHNPRFGYEILRRAAWALAQRLSATRLQLLDVFGAEHPVTAKREA